MLYTIAVAALTIIGMIVVPIVLYVFGIGIATIYNWFKETPIPEPVYDSSVRVKQTIAPQIIVGIIAFTFIIANIGALV